MVYTIGLIIQSLVVKAGVQSILRMCEFFVMVLITI